MDAIWHLAVLLRQVFIGQFLICLLPNQQTAQVGSAEIKWRHMPPRYST